MRHSEAVAKIGNLALGRGPLSTHWRHGQKSVLRYPSVLRFRSIALSSYSPGDDDIFTVLARPLAVVGTPAAILWALGAWSVSVLVQETDPATMGWKLGTALISLTPLACNLIGWLMLAKGAPRLSMACNALPVALIAAILATSAFSS